jgi:2'-5' RNA ligase
MSALYTLAYPELSTADADRLDALRRRHDPHHEVVAAHFTMVFACSGVDERTYVEHVAAVSRGTSPISFSCRYAMLGSDDEAQRGYVHLVPDEGYGAVSRLHDALYDGLLSSHLRLDIPFVPHITLGASTDRNALKRLRDELNGTNFTVHGSIQKLSVAALHEGRIRNLANISLGTVDS